jgi:DNA-binding winged helix-turn-helix (wHTH) protein
VHLSRLEFELLVKFTSNPVRVFSRDQLARCIWRQQQISARTVDSHVARLRTRLTAAGADDVLVNKWGQGWSLITRGSSHAIHGRAGHASYQLDEANAAFNPLQTNPSWSRRELRRQERESRESRGP